MRKFTALLLTAGILLSCATTGGIFDDDSGTFRGRWYNYYDRGIAASELGEWDTAGKDLQSAIAKRSRDQRMARTYGMHFIDYFPHRELGIVYLNTGEIDRAVLELEESISHEESAKAVYYLNKARRQQFLNKGTVPDMPVITVSSPANDSTIKAFTMTVKGQVTGDGYVSQLRINGMPFRVDLARKTVTFEHEIAVGEDMREIYITAEDLMGNVTSKTIPLSVDREGPAIAIFDIAAQKDNGDTICITGEVYDRSGLGNLLINGAKIDTAGEESYEFDIAVKRTAPGAAFSANAADVLGNDTTAVIDLEEELSAFRDMERPVLLAMVADGLFPLDEKPPEISLKDGTDLPAVFVNEYYVEGEVSDNKRVEEVMVNGKGLDTRQGRKVFFSKVVGLKEGSNAITVDAFDDAGNRAQAGFSVKRNVPEALQAGSRMSVTIFPFDANEQASLAGPGYEHLIGSFVEQKRFSIIERSRLEEVLREQRLSREKLTDPAHSIQLGRMMAAEAVLATSVAETDRSIEFVSRVINTETSEIMNVKDVYSEDKSLSSVKLLMQGLASKIAADFPLVSGMVIKKEQNILFTDLGSRERVRKNMGVIVYRKGAEIRHPVTGRTLGRDTIILGEARLEEIQEDFSKAEVRNTSGIHDITVQDLVITK